MSDMLQTVIGSITRWALQGIALWLIAHGVLTESEATKLLIEAGAMAVSGAVLVWSLLQKWQASKQKNQTATVVLGLSPRADTFEVNEALAEKSLPPVTLVQP